MEKIGARQLRGVSSGLLSNNDSILWALRILNKDFLFTLKITELNPVLFIQEEMMQGSLDSFKHLRHFKKIENGTLVIDEVFYALPKKFWSPWIDRFFVNGKLHELLKERNKILKEYAESNKWRALLTK